MAISKTTIKDSADQIKKDIVVWLMRGGMSFNVRHDAIGNEVLFSQARRRADLLILSEEFHALEIKGNADHLTKLPDQLEDYRKTFDKVSVVVTKKHLNKVERDVPKSVGIILIADDKITILRNACIKRKLDKASLLMFLNKNLLITLLGVKGSNLFTDELRQLAMTKNLGVIRESAYRRLKGIYFKLFQRFTRETKGFPIQIDEIRSLSAEVSPTCFAESNDEM